MSLRRLVGRRARERERSDAQSRDPGRDPGVLSHRQPRLRGRGLDP